MNNEEEQQAVEPELLPELQIDILLRLPVKSLLRFRCVSRAWNSTITSRPFVSLHHHKTRSQRDPGGNTCNLLLLHYSIFRRKDLYAIYTDDGESPLSAQIQRTDFPITYATYWYIASCNGLLCFSAFLNCPGIFLWNPSIRKSVQIPQSGFTITNSHTEVLGFGFDCRTNDYKIVRLIYYASLRTNSVTQVPPEIEIFELNRFKWRSNASVVPYIIPDITQAFVNGGVHWIGYNNRNHHQLSVVEWVVVVFDVHDEHFTSLEIPSEIDMGNGHDLPHLSVAVCGESLCLLQMNPWIEMEGRPREGVCYIWVMKQYGMKESWSRQLNVDMRGLGGLGRVIGFRKHGEILVVNASRDELVSYNPQNRGIQSLGLRGRFFHVMNYMESLGLLEGGGRGEEKED